MNILNQTVPMTATVKGSDPDFLRKRKAIIVADLLSKAEAEDWHGVADAAMDLREIEAKLEVLEAK